MEIVLKISVSFADSLVIYTTWRVTGNIRQLVRQRLGADISIASLLLTDGTSFNWCDTFTVHLALFAVGTLYYRYINEIYAPYRLSNKDGCASIILITNIAVILLYVINVSP